MELRNQGATVYQFEGGEPFMPTPDSVKEAMKRALDENQTRYAPSSGIPELREAIAEKLRTQKSNSRTGKRRDCRERRHAGFVRRISVDRESRR